MMASFMEGIEHALDNNHLSSLADRMLGWSGSDIQVCLPGGRRSRSNLL